MQTFKRNGNDLSRNRIQIELRIGIKLKSRKSGVLNLRRKIDIEPEKLNSILLDMADKGILYLYMQEDPMQLTPEIDAGSFKAHGGTYHLLHLK